MNKLSLRPNELSHNPAQQPESSPEEGSVAAPRNDSSTIMRPTAVLFLLLHCSSFANLQAISLYQLVVYLDDAPEDALDRIDADSMSLLGKLVSSEPGFQALEAGQSVPGSRHLELNDGKEVESSLRGGRSRELQAGGQCPSSCAHSGSSYCRSIGCAYCGASCSRRLEAVILASGARSVEASINKDLDKYCEARSGCSIRCEVFQVLDDGSAVPLA